MENPCHKILAGLLGMVLIISVGMAARQLAQYRQGAASYCQAQTVSGFKEEGSVPEGDRAPSTPTQGALSQPNIAALQGINPEVLGWLFIPGTPISYPLLQGADNDYYLSHTWDCQPAAVGAIFLESQNAGDLSDFHTVVYGHRMSDGSMFAALKYYARQDYWAQHPEVVFTDGVTARRYTIFGAFAADVMGEAYRIRFSSRQERQNFLDFCLAQSVLETDVVPTPDERILTLSTCTGLGHERRWVVQAVEQG